MSNIGKSAPLPELNVHPDAVRRAIESERFNPIQPLRASVVDPYLGFNISKSPVLNVAVGELERVATPRTRQAEAKTNQTEQGHLDDLLDETARTQILRALEASNGVIGGPSGAAARLGIKRPTLQLRMQRLGIRLSPMSRTPLTESKRTAG